MAAMWILFTFTSLFITVVSPSKSDILKPTKESWLLMENFTTMLNVYFVNSFSCCNVFIDDEFWFETSFNGLIKKYPNAYTLNRPTYACSEYLIISTSADRVVTKIKSTPTRIAIVKVLIIVTDDLEEVTIRLLDGSLFGNANVIVASLSGFWMLSENFLSPRIFKKVSSFSEMAHKKGNVNLQGRELRVAAYYKPPYCYMQTTVNRTVNGIKGEYYSAKDKSELDGTDVKVFMLIAEHLNFTWAIRKLPNTLNWYGMSNGTHWIGGMVGDMINNELDISFTSVWIERDKYPFTNLTKPLTMIRIHFLVPRPKPYSSFWALTRPLTPEVWSATFVMLILQSIYVYTRAWINPRIPKRFRRFVITWTELLGRLIGTSAPINMQGLHLQFQLWHFVGILLVTAYSCGLAADLTNLRFENKIDTARDFIEANLTWGALEEFHHFRYAVEYTDPWGRQLADHYVQHASMTDRDETISRGNFAILGNTFLSIFFPQLPVKDEFLSNFRLMQYSPAEFYVSLAVQPWLLEPVDKVMLQLTEMGLTQYHVDSVLHRNTGKALRAVLIEDDAIMNGPMILQLNPLGAGYALFIVGLVISIIVFYFEFKLPGTWQSTRQAN